MCYLCYFLQKTHCVVSQFYQRALESFLLFCIVTQHILKDSTQDSSSGRRERTGRRRRNDLGVSKLFSPLVPLPKISPVPAKIPEQLMSNVSSLECNLPPLLHFLFNAMLIFCPHHSLPFSCFVTINGKTCWSLMGTVSVDSWLLHSI